MKNKVAETHNDLYKEDISKASILDNCIHNKLSGINGEYFSLLILYTILDVRNQIKRNVLFNGYVKNFGPHWSYPRARTSLSPILSVPPQPKFEHFNKIDPMFLEFSGINLEKKINFANECFNVFI